MLVDVLEPLSVEYPRIAQYVEHVRTGEGPDPFMWEGRQVILAFSGGVEIMAQAMGLGGFYSMWIRMADDADHRELMSFIGCVDPGKRLGCAFVIGHPRIRYRRMAPRPEPTVHLYYNKGKRKVGPGGPLMGFRRSASAGRTCRPCWGS